MSVINTEGGFADDPAAALDVSGTSGCCGNPPRATLDRPDPTRSAGAGADGLPCCGTTAEASAADACCGASARAEAVASGAGCCG
jgi:hypothetical protein